MFAIIVCVAAGSNLQSVSVVAATQPSGGDVVGVRFSTGSSDNVQCHVNPRAPPTLQYPQVVSGLTYNSAKILSCPSQLYMPFDVESCWRAGTQKNKRVKTLWRK